MSAVPTAACEWIWSEISPQADPEAPNRDSLNNDWPDTRTHTCFADSFTTCDEEGRGTSTRAAKTLKGAKVAALNQTPKRIINRDVTPATFSRCRALNLDAVYLDSAVT